MSDDRPALLALPDPTVRIDDRELYEAWMQTHREIPEFGLALGPTERPRRTVMGGREYLFTQEGVCIAVIYRNPDLESQRERARFFASLAQEADDWCSCRGDHECEGHRA